MTEEINRNMTMSQSMVNQLTENGEKTMDSTCHLASFNEQLLAIASQFKPKQLRYNISRIIALYSRKD